MHVLVPGQLEARCWMLLLGMHVSTVHTSDLQQVQAMAVFCSAVPHREQPIYKLFEHVHVAAL